MLPRTITGKLTHAALATALLFGALPASAQGINEAFQRVNPTVVEIMTAQKDIVSKPDGQYTVIGGLGSGVVISDDGLILTAAHVVQTAEKLAVRFLDDEKEYEASVISSEQWVDVALVRISQVPENMQVATLGDSSTAKVGDQVFVIGAPLGVSHTLTVGHLSARRVPKTVASGMEQTELLQTDAAINQGNSGGPMFNMQGEVIGIVSYIVSQTGGSSGLGFAVSSNTARALLLERRGMWSGMEGVMLDKEMAAIFNVPQPAALMVQRVVKGSPTGRMGLRPGSKKVEIDGQELIIGGDIVLSVMGVSFADPEAMAKIRAKLDKLKNFDKITVKVLRGGQVVELEDEFMPQ